MTTHRSACTYLQKCRVLQNRLAMPFAAAAALLLLTWRPLHAQPGPKRESTPVRLVVGFGVDTSATPAREIFARWRDYLYDADGTRANLPWASQEVARYQDADLLRSFVYQGFTQFTLIHLGPSAGEPGVYELRTLVGRTDRETSDIYPLAVYSVYAVREEGRWVLSNALVHRTRAWPRYRSGSIDYAVASNALIDTVRARQTATFMDSIAAAFRESVPTISYYGAESLGAIYAALGLDFFPMGADTSGGRALVKQGVVLVGGTALTESNRHELTHVVLGRLSDSKTHRLMSEGLATWIGGSAGLSFSELLPGLAEWLSGHPDATLLDIMTNPPQRIGTLDVGYDVFAVIFSLAHERGGVRAVRELMRGGPSPEAALATVARVFGVATSDVDAIWRRRVRELGRGRALRR